MQRGGRETLKIFSFVFVITAGGNPDYRIQFCTELCPDDGELEWPDDRGTTLTSTAIKLSKCRNLRNPCTCCLLTLLVLNASVVPTDIVHSLPSR